MVKTIICPDCRGRGSIDRYDTKDTGDLLTAIATLRTETCPTCSGACSIYVPTTFADRIRAMSDEELTDAIYKLLYAQDPGRWFCKGTKECEQMMDNDEDIPDEMCKKCLLNKLRQPADEG